MIPPQVCAMKPFIFQDEVFRKANGKSLSIMRRSKHHSARENKITVKKRARSPFSIEFVKIIAPVK